MAQWLLQEATLPIYGVSGANIEDLFFELHQADSHSVILAKTEYQAALMAMGSYLATKKISVVMTTSGAGVLNTIPILAEAYTSRIPFVLISGTVPTSLEGKGGFQDTSGKGETFDLLKLLAPITCSVESLVNPQEVLTKIQRCFTKAMKDKRPAVLLIPKNIFSEVITVNLNHFSISDDKKTFPSESVENFQQWIQSSQVPPLFILGEELIHLKEAHLLQRFTEQYNAHVAVTPVAKGVFNHHSSRFMGMTGIMGHEKVLDCIKDSTHILFLGTQFDLLSRFGLEQCIQNKNICFINEFETSFEHFSFPPQSLILKDSMTDFIKQVTTPLNLLAPLQMQPILQMIESFLPEDANLFVDAGNCGAFALHHLKPQGRSVCYVALGMGGMGASIGTALGASLATKKRSFVFIGDGSFLMYGLEIHTAVEHNSPITFFIFNNNAHGMCSTRENVYFDQETGINNFQAMTFAHGFKTLFPQILVFDINNLEELEIGLQRIQRNHGVSLFSLNLPTNETPPFKAFIKKETP